MKNKWLRNLVPFSILVWLTGCIESPDSTKPSNINHLSEIQENNVLKTKYVYGNNFQIDTVLGYDSTGALQRVMTYEYKNGRPSVVHYVFPSTSSPSLNWNYQYDQNGLVIASSVYSDSSNLKRQSYKYEYDKNKQVVKTSQFDKDDSLISYTVFEHMNLNTVSVAYYLANDSSVGRINYTYDNKKNPYKDLSINFWVVSPNNFVSLTSPVSDASGKFIIGLGIKHQSTESTFEYNKDGYPLREIITETPIKAKYTTRTYAYLPL